MYGLITCVVATLLFGALLMTAWRRCNILNPRERELRKRIAVFLLALSPASAAVLAATSLDLLFITGFTVLTGFLLLVSGATFIVSALIAWKTSNDLDREFPESADRLWRDLSRVAQEQRKKTRFGRYFD